MLIRVTTCLLDLKLFVLVLKHVVILSCLTHWVYIDGGTEDIFWRTMRKFLMSLGIVAAWAATHAFTSYLIRWGTYWLLVARTHLKNIPEVQAKNLLHFVAKYSLLVILEWGSTLTLWLWKETLHRVLCSYSGLLTQPLSKNVQCFCFLKYQSKTFGYLPTHSWFLLLKTPTII